MGEHRGDACPAAVEHPGHVGSVVPVQVEPIQVGVLGVGVQSAQATGSVGHARRHHHAVELVVRLLVRFGQRAVLDQVGDLRALNVRQQLARLINATYLDVVEAPKLPNVCCGRLLR
jgi:hypothetical protein